MVQGSGSRVHHSFFSIDVCDLAELLDLGRLLAHNHSARPRRDLEGGFRVRLSELRLSGLGFRV